MHEGGPTRFFEGGLLGLPPRVAALVVGVGVASGLVGAAYLLVIHLLQHVLWPTQWSGAVGFLILGGVGVFAGLVTRYVGSPGDVELMVDNIHVSGTGTEVGMLRSLIPISWLCIASGGGMGPEAPMVQTTGTLASWGARHAGLGVTESRIITIAGMAAGFTVLFGTPLGSAVFALELLHRRGLQYYEALVPAILSSLAGYAVYVCIAVVGLRPVWHMPAPGAIHAVDLAWALLAGVAGALVAVIFTYLNATLRAVMRRIAPGFRPVIGGLSLAALGLASAYSLTFGEAQINTLLAHHDGTVAFFLLAALAKLAGTSVTLSSEWRGGFIIPLFFMGCALGRAFHVIFPGTNEVVMVVGLMAAANTGVTKTPIGSALVVTGMSSIRLLPTTLLATITALLLTENVGLIHTQRERDIVGEPSI
ncbi:MAG TPA: chloride channel protein [Acidimicrobiia bacterium]